jgi:hypothetical protein
VNRRQLTLSLVLFGLAAGACALPSLRVMDQHGVNVLAYQFAGTTGRAQELNQRLGVDGRAAARESLWWDFPLLVSYGLLFAVLCRGVATRAAAGGRARLAARGRQFAVLGVVAAACDAVEDFALLRVADGQTDQPWPGIACVFSAVKWLLVLGCVAYLCTGWLITRRSTGTG